MKIYVEGSSLINQRSGVGQYGKRLIEAFVKKYPEQQVTIFGFKFFSKGQVDKPIKKVSYEFVRWLPGRAYNLLHRHGVGLPIDILLRRRPDVIMFPNFIRWPVQNKKTKTIIIIYDLSFVFFPQFTSARLLKDTKKFVSSSIKKASHIITISENSKEEIVAHYKISPDKVSIIYPGVDRHEYYVQPKSKIDAARKKYLLPQKYILYTGTLEPRKNIEGIVMAYKNLDKKFTDEYGLVLAGGKGWLDESIIEAIDKARHQGFQIITTGYVPDEDLPSVYSGASVLVYPSFYEGFGMPPVEAMACAVPVITSNNSSLPEAVGDAAITLDANDTQALSSAIKEVLSDKKLADVLISKGLAQAARFSWDKSADRLFEVFKKAAR